MTPTHFKVDGGPGRMVLMLSLFDREPNSTPRKVTFRVDGKSLDAMYDHITARDIEAVVNGAVIREMHAPDWFVLTGTLTLLHGQSPRYD